MAGEGRVGAGVRVGRRDVNRGLLGLRGGAFAAEGRSELCERLKLIGHDASLWFLVFIAATSSTSGF